MEKFTAGLILLSGVGSVFAIKNGKGITPPMGWRSWNLFGANVNQDLIQSQMVGITNKDRLVNGVPTSLLDLGYSDVGLDDAWQLCGDYTNRHFTYHDETGAPVIDTSLFPDFKAMTDYVHSIGLTAGWYGNNCICEDHCSTDDCYQQDVNALVGLGFDSVKLDGCGKQLDLQKWSDLIDATDSSILIENCHWGLTVPNATWCPWNYYRSSGDIRASYEYVLSNLMSTVPLAKQELSTPGCWAYPDMLEVGCQHGPGGDDDPGLSYAEARTHFGAWCIVSSPLILSHDMNNQTVTDDIWDIITNTEAIAVNQAWAGDSGTIFAESSRQVSMVVETVTELGGQGNYQETTFSVSDWQQWAKRLPDGKSAVLLMNNADETQEVTLRFDQIPAFVDATIGDFEVRDLWARADLGTFSDSMSVSLESHDSAFLVVTVSPKL